MIEEFFSTGFNDLTKAGIITTLFAGLLYRLNYIWYWVCRGFERFFCFKITIESNNKHYGQVVNYLAKNLSYKGNILVDTTGKYDRQESTKSIGYATFMDRLDGKFVIVSHHQKDVTPHIDVGEFTRPVLNIITIKYLFTRKNKHALKLLENAEKEFDLLYDKQPRLHISGTYGSWQQRGHVIHRSLDSVVLDRSTKKNMLNEIDHFVNSKDKYHKLGVPYKRGILLDGPPGNGKTSIIRAIASHYNRDLYVFSYSKKMSDVDLIDLFSSIEPHSIVVIEDIDSIFDKREMINQGDFTFSAFLNALDGLSSAEDYILFVTCNDRSKLDEAMTRKGRIDSEYIIGPPTTEQLKEICNLYEVDFREHANSLVTLKNMAEVQNFLMDKKHESLC